MADSGFFVSISATDATYSGNFNGYFVTIAGTDGSYVPDYDTGFAATISVTDATYLPVLSSGYMVSINTGRGIDSNALSFTYVLTSITDIIPDPAPMPGGVTIIGVMLDKVSAVYMDGQRVSFRVLSPTQIYAGLPLNVSSTTIDVYVEYQI